MTPTSPGQDPGTPGPAQEPAPAGLIWTRPLKEKRERPTREAIVAAATGLADTHGLDAVSIRRVAAALSTRPMDLYRYFARKDELIDLMADEAVAGAVLGEIPRHWRDALAAIARAMRAVCLAHPWMVTAAGQQALIGPNVMRHVEQSLEATAALGIDWTKRLAIWRAVDTYVMGHAHLSLARDHSEGNTASDPGWRAAADAYLQGLAGSGSFPNLAAFGAAGLLHNEYDELTFETGLNWLLAGIAADCEAIAPRSSPL
ncbi:MAG TPA: TetR/AcrR family transcriptional regulator [Trebonia sp.]